MNSNTHISIYPKHLPVAVELARLSHQRFALDHLAKPPIKPESSDRGKYISVNLRPYRMGSANAGSENTYGLEPSRGAIRRNQASPDAPLLIR